MKRSKSEIAFEIANTLIMLLAILATAYPMLYVLLASVSESNELFSHTGPLWRPLGFSLGGYKRVLMNPNILTGYINTIVILITGTALNILMSCLGAYVLSRKRFGLKKVFTILVVFTMYFSGGLIPSYLLIVNTLHLKNTLMALILPGAMSVWNTIILRTAFQSVPASLEESARIDGAQDFQILFYILVPVSMATLAVLVLFYGVSHWNSWFGAVLYIDERGRYPLQLILREILVLSKTSEMDIGVSVDDKEALGESIKYATIIVATVPILCVYPFLQKYFVKGVMVGSVKG